MACTGLGIVVGHPPILVDEVEEEALHELEVVVVVVPAVVSRLLLRDQKSQVLRVVRKVVVVATDDSEDGVAAYSRSFASHAPLIELAAVCQILLVAACPIFRRASP